MGALGDLEELAYRLALIQNASQPELKKPHMLVFAGDHGIAAEGVSAYPSEITYQMVLNFVRGGAAINVFARQHQMELKVIDAGVRHDFEPSLPIVHAKIAQGTRNFSLEKAMTSHELSQALEKGSEIVEEISRTSCNVLGFGEMGIGNTSSASMLMSCLMELPLEDCVGRGTGLNDEKLAQKIRVLQEARNKYPARLEVADIMQTFGGLEIAMMAGAMLKAAERGMILLIDGFICTSALLWASKLYPEILEYCIFCHQSQEAGHGRMLDHLQAHALLRMNLRLGEGTGAALAYPLLVSAVKFLEEMASFDDLE